MRLLRTSASLLLLGSLVTVGVWFWPANLGGNTTYVSTHGTSMIPRFHAGDLAIVQPAAHYHVGEITAYHSATLHTVVLHRIVAIHGGRFTFKGDNNNFFDPDHPTAELLVGRLVARIPHGGEYRGVLAKPIVLFPVLVLVFGGFVFGARRSRRRRTRGRAPRPGRGGQPAGDGHVGARGFGEREMAVLVVGALATSAAFLAAVIVWHVPRTQATVVTQPYRQTATIGYSGAAPRGAVYPDGRLHTGDPMFTKMIHRATVELHFAFATDGIAHSVRGTSEVVADVSSATGWHRELVLSSRRAFAGDRVDTTARLDLRSLQRVQNAFSAETGLSTPDATLQIIWKLHVGGDAAGTPLSTDLTPTLSFMLTPVELLPASAPGGASPGTAGASMSKAGSAHLAAVRGRTFTWWRLHVPDGLARWLAIALVALALAATATILAVERRRTARGAAGTLLGRYRYLLVNADAIPLAGRRPEVEVDSMRDLVRLAKLHEELIVHAEESGRHRFALFTDAVVYLYEVPPAARVSSGSDDLAKWALAGLEACAAERRRISHAPSTRHARAGTAQKSPETHVVDGASALVTE
jgi:signal peptidase I